MGVSLTTKFPEELNVDYNRVFDDSKTDEDLFEQNPYSALIYKVSTSLNDVHGFYVT
jgi:hypothetical protein